MSVALTLTEQTFILCPIDNITPMKALREAVILQLYFQ